MKLLTTLTLLMALLCCHQDSLAQTQKRYLLLRKVGRPYKIIFNEGQSIRFKLKGEKNYNKGLIQGFGKDYIRFHYFTVKLDEIAEIDVRAKNFTIFSFRSGPGKLHFAGLGYLVLDQFNQTAVQKESFGVSKNTAIISSAIFSSGFLLKAIQKKRFKMNKNKHRLEIIDL